MFAAITSTVASLEWLPEAAVSSERHRRYFYKGLVPIASTIEFSD